MKRNKKINDLPDEIKALLHGSVSSKRKWWQTLVLTPFILVLLLLTIVAILSILVVSFVFMLPVLFVEKVIQLLERWLL